MFSKSVVSALVAAGTVLAMPADPVSKRDVNFDFGSTKVQGVNIGGWLVLEPWITPSIFRSLNGVVDEYTLGQTLGQDAALSILTPHWDTWVTLADFQKIASAGFNTVRIPIGYWAFQKFDNDSYVQGAAPYLDNAINWARQTGLKVWIDLHGAPGSQNGFDNSGQRTSNLQFQQGNNTQNTLQVLQQIADRYAKQQDVVSAIELLNEPLGPELDLNNLKQFYTSGYGEVRSDSNTPVVIHDAFQTASYWNGFLTPSSNSQNVILDHHEYQVFSDSQIQWQPREHRQQVCNLHSEYSGSDKWTVVGEWTAAMTDCAFALNGYGIGARYDGTYPGSSYVGSCAGLSDLSTWNQTLKDNTRQYIEAQLETFETYTQGWIFWNFKTESAAEWDAFQLLDAGIFPQPLSSRKYGMVCGS